MQAAEPEAEQMQAAGRGQAAGYDGYYTGNSTDIAPVGTAPLGAGFFGQLDMAGELFEWNLDWYDNYTATCTNCADTTDTGASSRAMQGGIFNFPSSYLLPPDRNDTGPTNRFFNIGFRCARTP
jgi:formylglycine-generating enzyme required for sulfatase activity